MEKGNKRGNFTGSIGFVLAAAGSAVGLGNIWRFPYLAAKDGGGTFILVYIILALTFGFTLLTTDVAIGKKNRTESVECVPDDSPQMGRSWHSGVYHSGCDSALLLFHRWMGTEISGNLYHRTWGGSRTGRFTGYITSMWQPILWLFIYLLLTAFVVYKGVNKGIENYSRILMPILLVMIVGISIFSMTLSHSDADGVTRTGCRG